MRNQRQARKRQISLLWHKVHDLEAKILELIKHAYPVGYLVNWHHGRHVRYGIVQDHYFSCGLRSDFFVESPISGKRFRVGIWNVLRYDGLA